MLFHRRSTAGVADATKVIARLRKAGTASRDHLARPKTQLGIIGVPPVHKLLCGLQALEHSPDLRRESHLCIKWHRVDHEAKRTPRRSEISTNCD